MLEVKNLYKSYGDFLALKGMDFIIPDNTIYGFVGPNGAGKTTTMKIISGLLRADTGDILLDGESMIHNMNELKSKIGYMPDFFGVYDNLKVLEYMEFYASLYGIDGVNARKLCEELIELVNLKDKRNCYVDELSRGMKQRLCLARTMVHDPEILVLDEPASGMDPRARIEMKDILKNLRDKGRTILISSHILPELAELCNNIGIVEEGRMIISGSVTEIMDNYNMSNPLVIRFTGDRQRAMQVIKRNRYVESVSILENSVFLTFAGKEEEEAELLTSIIATGAKVNYYAREEGNLESLFMKITEDDMGGMTEYENESGL
ncbi:ABC transporter, ATP-binding protein [Lachnospiraceae bacterium KM106-2]|nr:ABC transporter, ATP-binding protein [Lachnospiraceae bacterium KM106-2]